MLRVLIVDDWQHRHDTIVDRVRRAGMRAEFRHRTGPGRVTDDDLAWAHVAFLDHDMCQRGVTAAGILVDPDDDMPCQAPVAIGGNSLDLHCGCPTGTDLVRRMAESEARPAVVVHTANTVEAPRMVAALADAGSLVRAMPASRWTGYDWRVVLRNVGVG